MVLTINLKNSNSATKMTRVLSTTVNGIKTFHITGESALPGHYGQRAARRIGTHAELQNRIDFISEFEFPGCSRSIQITKDGTAVGVTGEYPPMLKIFDLLELSQTTQFSVQRIPNHFEFLSDDWSKMVVLRSDRKLDFYTKAGLHYSLSLPVRCRHFAYSHPTADLILATEDAQLLRLNLEAGQFYNSIPTNAQTASYVTICEQNQLIVAGYEGGLLEFYDPRDKRIIGTHTLDADPSKLQFSPSGGYLGVGLTTGVVQLYDIRSANPMFSYNHRNNSPIHSLSFHNNNLIVSGDRKGCRIHSIEQQGKFFTSFETKAPMNQVVPFPNSGLFFATVEAPQIQTFLIPDIGTAPRWASHLDSLIQDVEAEQEADPVLREGKKFITREELEKYGMTHLLGSKVLEASAHGFFISRELYRMIISKDADEEKTQQYFDAIHARQKQEEDEMIIQKRKAPKKDLGDLEVKATDSKRKKKMKKLAANDTYYN